MPVCFQFVKSVAFPFLYWDVTIRGCRPYYFVPYREKCIRFFETEKKTDATRCGHFVLPLSVAYVNQSDVYRTLWVRTVWRTGIFRQYLSSEKPSQKNWAQLHGWWLDCARFFWAHNRGLRDSINNASLNASWFELRLRNNRLKDNTGSTFVCYSLWTSLRMNVNSDFVGYQKKLVSCPLNRLLWNAFGNSLKKPPICSVDECVITTACQLINDMPDRIMQSKIFTVVQVHRKSWTCMVWNTLVKVP